MPLRQAPHGETRVLRDGSDMYDAIREHWMPVFPAPAMDPEAAGELSRQGAHPWDLQGLRPPRRRTFVMLRSRIRNTAPGPDGLPYAMRQASGYSGAGTLAVLTEALSAGILVQPRINVALALLPK